MDLHYNNDNYHLKSNNINDDHIAIKFYMRKATVHAPI